VVFEHHSHEGSCTTPLGPREPPTHARLGCPLDRFRTRAER
jgi:hypothetical protein